LNTGADEKPGIFLDMITSKADRAFDQLLISKTSIRQLYPTASTVNVFVRAFKQGSNLIYFCEHFEQKFLGPFATTGGPNSVWVGYITSGYFKDFLWELRIKPINL